MDNSSYPREFKTPDGRVLVVDCARLEDLEEVSNFIQQNFIAKSPNLYLIPYDEEKSEAFSPFLSSYMHMIISQSVSLCVRDPSAGGRIAAVSLNKIKLRNDLKEEASAEDGQSPREDLLIYAFLRSLN